MLESVLSRYTLSDHFNVPARTELTRGLAELYKRADPSVARAAYDRDGADSKVKEAAQRALGEIGTLADYDRVKGLPEAEVALFARWDPGRLREFLAKNWPANAESGTLSAMNWSQKDQKTRLAVLKAVARGAGDPERDLAILTAGLHGKLGTDRYTYYIIAEAFAEVALRLGRTGGLTSMLSSFIENNSMTTYNQGRYAVLLALLYTAQKAGEPDALPALEEIMQKEAGSMATDYEQAFFETPITWAKVVVRNGLFSEKAPQIMEWLTSHKPMQTAAALYAIALERQRLGGDGEEDIQPREAEVLDMPQLDVSTDTGSSSSNYGGYPYFGRGNWRQERLDRMFDPIPPMMA